MDGKDLNVKPSISDKGLVYIVTEAFPPTSVGSSVLNKNLFTYFDPKSYVIYTHSISSKNDLDRIKDVQLRFVAKSLQYFSGRLHNLLLPLQLKYAFYKITSDAKKEKPVAIVATHPGLAYLKLGLQVATHLKIPFFPYLHDTIAEALSTSAYAAEGLSVQQDVWKRSAHIFVMSEGMKELYKKKYDLLTEPVLHTYLEEIMEEKDLVKSDYAEPHCFWGGAVYDINNVSLPRLTTVLENLNPSIEIASPQKMEAINGLGIKNKKIKLSFYSSRSNYLTAVEDSDILLLALNWPSESHIHPDELGTIFPTKTPEYLAAGKLIIVHAPEEYFLTSFLKKYNCGIILDQNDPAAMLHKLKKELENKEQILSYRKNALAAAEQFKRSSVAENFKKSISNFIQ